ncbi:DNA-directed RNA polymerase subunit beta [Neobacillus drentensis]|uniref:DNA-directed RNA polymerase subunit beta n=1 Tax=Neobacillus drentensis TaxID=220684 RepID=UPI001F3144D8|nr:DNA-directed RNA polymerase subunit beta [Neobacillus drentensis]ULT56844.1 DNA-directed RNA polymerase subunit beta [Neobacillus drentensis]
MTGNNGQASTREEYKKAKQEAVEQTKAEKPKKTEAAPAPKNDKRVRTRLIPIWLRLVLLLASILICVMAGATVGYGVLGGGNVGDVFKESTWTHIIDLVDKE